MEICLIKTRNTLKGQPGAIELLPKQDRGKDEVNCWGRSSLWEGSAPAYPELRKIAPIPLFFCILITLSFFLHLKPNTQNLQVLIFCTPGSGPGSAIAIADLWSLSLHVQESERLIL